MYALFPVRGTIHSSTGPNCHARCTPLVFITATCRVSVDLGRAPDSINTGWRNASFRGYADYMQTPEFREHLDELIKLAKSERIAIMCAEAVPWRCHRSLIADALVARGVEVREITSSTRAQPHKLTPWGKIAGDGVTYPAAE